MAFHSVRCSRPWRAAEGRPARTVHNSFAPHRVSERPFRSWHPFGSILIALGPPFAQISLFQGIRPPRSTFLYGPGAEPCRRQRREMDPQGPATFHTPFHTLSDLVPQRVFLECPWPILGIVLGVPCLILVASHDCYAFPLPICARIDLTHLPMSTKRALRTRVRLYWGMAWSLPPRESFCRQGFVGSILACFWMVSGSRLGHTI